mmetsp:Transcript_17412/g.29188  ORF Transcript_17412/g.29188 Transcript_17412/m.29188 type:complete len:634 (-) Transcript_17412:189-2090(-)
MSLRKVFNLTNLTIVIVVAYLYVVINNLYNLMNPLANVIIDPLEETVNPLWDKHQGFSLVCFLSNSPKFTSFSIPKMEQSGKLLLHLDNLTFHNDDDSDSIEKQVSIADSNSSDLSIYVKNKKIWQALQNNQSSVYLHALTVKHTDDGVPPDTINTETMNSGQGAYGVVPLVKYDVIPKHFRHRCLLEDLGFEGLSSEVEAAQAAMPSDTVISFWKPEVAVRLVTDFTLYPLSHNVPVAIRRNVIAPKYSVPANHRRINSGTPYQKYYKPAFHADEMGLTSDKYIPLNETVQSLPLKITYEPMSVQRWLLMNIMEESLATNKEMGFSDKDLDDVRRLVSDTSIYFLGITLLASVLHMTFEALAFQSDISFWQENKSLTGLSVRSLITDLISQFIILLFLMDSETSLLVIIPSGFGVLVQLWKVWKATGVTLRGGRIVFTRFEDSHDSNSDDDDTDGDGDDDVDCTDNNSDSVKKENMSHDNQASKKHEAKITSAQEKELAQVTLAADRIAIFYLGFFFIPLVFGFSAFTLIMNKHVSWYSWVLTTLTTSVYTGGFVLMCPQLFINHKLKSVAHLPWKLLCFRFVNTFIDDLFAFIIKMPAMHRLSVFRDDFVFLVYMYQRYIYRIDESRPVEK